MKTSTTTSIRNHQRPRTSWVGRIVILICIWVFASLFMWSEHITHSINTPAPTQDGPK